MEAVEPREEEMKQMNYEVSYNLLIDYANNLLESPNYTKKKRLGTYQEIIAQAQPNHEKEKKKKDDQAVSVLTDTRVVEDDTHQAAKDILRMNEQLKNYHNKPDQTESRAALELETEEILRPDEIYTDKDKDDTKSPPVILFVDDTEDTQDTINTTGTNNETDKEKEQELGKGTKEVKEVEKEKDQEKDKEPIKTSEEQVNQETNKGDKSGKEHQKQAAIEPSLPTHIVISDDVDEMKKFSLEL
ncbi:uncharacterized protein LOC131875776 [Cryptomeria japonica]|uniref:uncharacterized protein LOC131875776 n=1 Tax=Cryptomeria japonica TaxID=3369 RepID=UPI0027DA2C29|nr:uncharacterized protein LOC131875776 [Cryptomeria japonica]